MQSGTWRASLRFNFLLSSHLDQEMRSLNPAILAIESKFFSADGLSELGDGVTQLDGLANSIASTSALTKTNNIWGYSVSIQLSDLDLIDSTVQIQVNFLT